MAPYVDDTDFTLYVGDAAEVLRELPAESVHCVVTSPPYWGLRSYLPSGHDDKPLELGSEPTPEAYVENMVAVFREVRRVLRRDGTCWLNLGDSYVHGPSPGYTDLSKSGLAGLNSPSYVAKLQAGSGSTRATFAPGLKPKDLVGIPWRVAFALQADGWYLRSDIIWSKPNPMPESVTDRPTKAHEYLFLLTREARYFYDADAIREAHDPASLVRAQNPRNGQVGVGKRAAEFQNMAAAWDEYKLNPSGRNKRSVWEIATEPYPDAHFATFPQALVEPCVKAGTSERGCCPECGAPWVREVELVKATEAFRNSSAYWQTEPERGKRVEPHRTPGMIPGRTIGWKPPCDCLDEAGQIGFDRPPHKPIPCTVLDPFMGSGTTALVARKHGRRSIGVELSPEYAALAARRLSQLSLLAEAAV